MPFESMLHVLHGNKVIFIVIVIVIVIVMLVEGATGCDQFYPYHWIHRYQSNRHMVMPLRVQRK